MPWHQNCICFHTRENNADVKRRRKRDNRASSLSRNREKTQRKKRISNRKLCCFTFYSLSEKLGLIAIHNRRLFLLFVLPLPPNINGAHKTKKSSPIQLWDHLHIMRMTECFFWPNIWSFFNRKKQQQREDKRWLRFAFVAFSWLKSHNAHLPRTDCVKQPKRIWNMSVMQANRETNRKMLNPSEMKLMKLFPPKNDDDSQRIDKFIVLFHFVCTEALMFFLLFFFHLFAEHFESHWQCESNIYFMVRL